MPTYCFRTDDGELIERVSTIARRKKSIRLPDGRIARRDIVAEWGGRRDIAGNWPMLSSAVGGRSWQIRDKEDQSVRLGVPTRFVKTKFGCAAEFTGREHRNRYLKALGVGDLDAGYGDHTPRSMKTEQEKADREQRESICDFLDGAFGE